MQYFYSFYFCSDFRLSIIEKNMLTSYERFQVIDKVTLSDLKVNIHDKTDKTYLFMLG